MYSDDVLAKLHTCLGHITAIEKYTNGIAGADEFVQKYDGLIYDGTLMRLQALTEMLKKISAKHPNVIEDLDYPEIADVIKFRDYASHHYELLLYEVVYSLTQADIPKLKQSLLKLVSTDV